MALQDDELAAWLRLMHTGGIGREGVRRLLTRLGTPEAVLQAEPAAWRQAVGSVGAAALACEPVGHAARVANTRAWLTAAPGRRVMVLGDADFPPLLLNTADPPLLLYLEGNPKLMLQPALAIVGSRKPTPQGAENAHSFARQLGAQGLVIVSGLATGVDGAAHEGALQAQADAAGPGTVAVVGTGLDIVYPHRHRALAARIARAGLLVSEMPLGAPPLAAHFPQRNRIIAGLARGTLVVEAALPSGSLITARLALEAGREVMAIPGSIHSAASRGCNDLIRQGAALVQSPDDVVAELGGAPGQATLPLAPGPGPGAAADDDTDPVLRALGHDPASLDTLIARCGWPAPALSAHLLALELAGQVARLPGGQYQRLRQC